MLNITHELIQDVEPTIAALEPPTHTGFGHGQIAIHHHLWILLTQQLV
jgi:hypothetical protein